MPVEQLLEYVRPELDAAGWWRPEFDGAEREWLLRCIDAIRSRFTMLGDFRRRGQAYFSDDFETEQKAVENLDKDNARELLHELGDRVAALDVFNEETAEAALRALADEKGVKAGLLINGSRAALSGQSVGPSAFAVFDILGKDRVVKRLRNC
jgi:glutamyl-tRNA synthetase